MNSILHGGEKEERKMNTLDNLISILKTSIDAGQTIITQIYCKIRKKREEEDLNKL